MGPPNDANQSPFPQNKYKKFTMDLDGPTQQQALSRTKTNAAGHLNLQLDNLGGNAAAGNNSNADCRLETQQSQGSPEGLHPNKGNAGYGLLRAQNATKSMTAIASFPRQAEQMRNVSLSQAHFANQIQIDQDGQPYPNNHVQNRNYQGSPNIHIQDSNTYPEQ